MAWYNRSRFVYNAFSRFSLMVFPKNPAQFPTSRVKSNASSLFYHKVKPFGIFGSPSISTKLENLRGFRKNQSSSLFSGITRRNYSIDRNQILDFIPRDHESWFANLKIKFIAVLVSSGVVITVYFGNIEVVPYSKRKHLVILPAAEERGLGESRFNELKKKFEKKILPDTHPDSVRIRLIFKHIIEGLQRGISEEKVWGDLSYASESVGHLELEGHETLKALTDGKEDELCKKEKPDDKWVKDSRKQGEKQGTKGATEHLHDMKWEVLVVDEPILRAFCIAGGKIFVYTGLIKQFNSDAELALMIGHEVAHVVARHTVESITKALWFVIWLLILLFINPTFAMLYGLRILSFYRKLEREADYIGLMLMASAGYDPRLAPQVYEKMEVMKQMSSVLSKLNEYISTHPSWKTRAQLLARADTMEEAINIYREVIAGRAIEGSL